MVDHHPHSHDATPSRIQYPNTIPYHLEQPPAFIELGSDTDANLSWRKTSCVGIGFLSYRFILAPCLPITLLFGREHLSMRFIKRLFNLDCDAIGFEIVNQHLAPHCVLFLEAQFF